LENAPRFPQPDGHDGGEAAKGQCTILIVVAAQIGLTSSTVVYPGDKDYALTDNIRVRGLKGYLPDS